MKIFDGYVLISDFDGTLINGNGVISEENIDAIKYFVENGGLFSGATGRTQLSIGNYKNYLPIDAPWILYNGGAIYDFKNKKFLYIENINNTELVPIIKLVLEKISHINIQVCTTEMLYLVNPNGIPDLMVVDEGQIHKISNAEDIEEPWLKLMFQGNKEDLGLAEKVLEENLNLETYRYFYSGVSYLEVMGKGISKGSGLKALRKYLGKNIKLMCAIGDYYNDIEMLKLADISATPDNAPEDIKEVATVVVNHHDNHAVKHFIEWLERREQN